jgi:hypothetical protein
VTSIDLDELGRSRDYGNVIHIGASEKAALLSQLRKYVGLLVDFWVIDCGTLRSQLPTDTLPPNHRDPLYAYHAPRCLRS